MTRVLILGAGGMLGHKAYQLFSREFETIGTVRRLDAGIAARAGFAVDGLIANVEAEQTDSVARAIDAAEPDWVLNCIGIVKQRDDAKRPRPSIEVNALFPHVLADLCEARGAQLIHLSTDCVFSGARGSYTEVDVPDPVDLYGATKLLGELDRDGVLTIRTSMIGRELTGRTSLVEWFLAQPLGAVRGYTQAFFSGLTTRALSRELARIIRGKSTLRGIYHLSADRISKYDLLALVNAAYGGGHTLTPDDSFACDRSLDSSRYRADSGFVPDSWSAMIAEMAADQQL